MSDDEIYALKRGGHDPFKVFQAYAAAKACKNKPSVILAKTVKGYGMGEAGEGQNTTHSQKKLGLEQVKNFAKRFDVPVTQQDAEALNFYKPAPDSEEMLFLKSARKKLGGSLPSRIFELEDIKTPALSVFSTLLESSNEREMSTTMVLNRIMTLLVRDKLKKLSQLSPMRRVLLAWKGCFANWVFILPRGSYISLKILIKLCGIKRTKKDRFYKRVSMKQGRFLIGLPQQLLTRLTTPP
jgi:pyruvate dehydrogenase complex dehydrogenase (E1) component